MGTTTPGEALSDSNGWVCTFVRVPVSHALHLPVMLGGESVAAIGGE